MEFSRICFHEIVRKPFSPNPGFILQLFTEHIYIFMWDADTVIIGVITEMAFKYEIEYMVKNNDKNQGTKYRPLRNIFF